MKTMKLALALAFALGILLPLNSVVAQYSQLVSYKVEIYSMRCLEEDDPGGGIEIYGKIRAQLDYRGRDRRVNKSPKTIWSRSESRPFEMDEHETYYRKGSAIFQVPKNEVRNVRINLSEDLFEDDGSSADDKFRIREHDCSKGYHSWASTDGSRMKTIVFVEGDTRVQVLWRVMKV